MNNFRLTHKRQPNELQPEQGHDRKYDPNHGLHIQRHPKESLISSILFPRIWIRAFKNPAPISCTCVHFIPPAQSNEAPTSDVLQVIEVHGEQEHGDDEDHDETVGEEFQAEHVYYKGG